MKLFALNPRPALKLCATMNFVSYESTASAKDAAIAAINSAEGADHA